MNAKEMFEECGYIKIENANTIEYSRSEEDYIYFEKGALLIIFIYNLVDYIKNIKDYEKRE